MKATIERATLLKSLGHVQSVVERRNTIPILSNVLMEARDDGSLRLMATDLDLQVDESVPAQVAQAGATTVPAHTFFEIVRKLNATEGVSFLLAEQNTNMALKHATYGYILETGRVVMDGPAQMLRENEDVKEFYLGVAEGSRKSFRDVKSYKRRKRWLA